MICNLRFLGKCLAALSVACGFPNVRAQEAAEQRVPRWVDILPFGTPSGNPLADSVAYMFTLTPRGDPAEERGAEQAKAFRKIPGVKTGALLQCTLGHGGHPGEGVTETPWQRMEWNKPGNTKYYKFCPLDPRFRDYIARQCRAIAAAKPDFFMIDDDTRLEKGCFCALHRAAYEKVKGEKTWKQFTEDTLADYVQLIRDCFPGEIPGMFCCVSSTTDSAARMARIAAGAGHRPVLRVGGAPYWGGNVIFSMLTMRGLYARERELVADGGVALLMEADTCPHVLARTSTTHYTDFLQVVALEGFTGAKMWITPTTPEKYRTEAFSHARYRAALARDLPAIRYLTESANKGARGAERPAECGVKIVLGAKPAPYDVNDWGKSCLGRHGIAYRYGKWTPGDVAAVVGDEVGHFTDGELKDLASGPLLLDKSAAAAFAARGLAEALKAPHVATVAFDVRPYPQHYSKMASLYQSGKEAILAALRKIGGGRVPGRVYVADYGSYHLATGFDRDGARYVLIDNLDLDIPDRLTVVTSFPTEGLEEMKGGAWQPADAARTPSAGAETRTALNGPFLPHRPRLFRINQR